MEKPNMVHSYNKILLNDKNEGSSKSWKDIDES